MIALAPSKRNKTAHEKQQMTHKGGPIMPIIEP